MKPETHLIIPQLFQPLVLWQKDFVFKPEAPCLSALLTQYDATQSHRKKGIDASLFASVGFSDKELPSAYYRSQTHSTDSKRLSRVQATMTRRAKEMSKSRGGDYKSDAKTLICADPVHLEVGMNDITLTDRITDLSDDEAQEIVEALNQHFNQDGLEFIVGAANQWYLLLPREKNLSTTPVDEVLRKNIAHFLPSSDDRNWQMIQNEVQMLLHSLPINQQREMQGLVTVNSLWFWGSGDNQRIEKSVNSVYSTIESKGKTLARVAQCDHQEIKGEMNIQTSLKGRTVFILDQLSLPAIYDDIDAYQHELSIIDKQFIEPLLSAWQAGQINVIIDGCDGRLIQPIAYPAWKFWAKKPRPLNSIAMDLS